MEGKPAMRFWMEVQSEEQKDGSSSSYQTTPQPASASSSSSASSSYITDSFRSASSMLKGGEGPLTENSSAFDLSSHAAASAAPSSPSSPPAAAPTAPASARQYQLLSESDMAQPLDTYPLVPLSRVLVDKLLPSGQYSRSSEPAAFRQFAIGDKLDARDTVQKWYESIVRDVKDGKVFIHFNNWDAKWDEVRPSPTHTERRRSGHA